MRGLFGQYLLGRRLGHLMCGSDVDGSWMVMGNVGRQLRIDVAHEIQHGTEMPVLLSSGHTCIFWLHGWPTRRKHQRRPGNRRMWRPRAGPSRTGPRTMSSAHRKPATSVNESDCQGCSGSGCNAVEHHGDALEAPIRGGRITTPTPIVESRTDPTPIKDRNPS